MRIEITPVAKPRMTQSDRWNERPATRKYWRFKDELGLLLDGWELPPAFDVIFHVPMPKSWSQKKKRQMVGAPHQQRPDRDNFLKAFQDALCQEDSYIYDGRVAKFWTDGPGYIQVVPYE